MSSNVIPFGKYKGQPIEAIQHDKQYLDWLANQSWFKERYQNLNAIIINNFNEPAETPEHNKLQAMFTDDDFCLKFILNLEKVSGAPVFKKQTFNPKWVNIEEERYRLINKPLQIYASYEAEGVDVKLHVERLPSDQLKKAEYFESTAQYSIEIKPVLGDDYPGVLRQMKNNKSTILFIEAYAGAGATLDQIKKIFQGITIVTLQEVLNQKSGSS